MDYIHNIVGLVGVSLLLIMYILVQRGKVSVFDVVVPGTNFVGAILILISLWHSWNLASVVIEVMWLCISGWGIASCLLRARRARK